MHEMTKDRINYALSHFICEVCKVDGSGYPGATTYEMVTNLQKYLEMNPVYHKLLTDQDLKELQLTCGCGNQEKKARRNKSTKETS